MQKLINKTDSNIVGAGPVSAQEKGITLIALIITIIVMLILVGVTINVALNGGLFEKAETATRETEEKAILEEMLAMMELTDDGKIDYTKIKDKMILKYGGATYSYPNITIPGKLGTYKYIVSETEIKIGSKEIDTFDWEDVGLTVDTETDYIFNDLYNNTVFVIKFTTEGNLIVKKDGTTVTTYDATDAKNINSDGYLTVPFTYNGTSYDTTLRMNSNNIDVDAELKNLTTVTYVKEAKTDFIAYESRIVKGVYIVEISPTEVIFYYNGEIYNGNKIKPCTDVFTLNGTDTFDGFINYTEFNIKYSKALLDENDIFTRYIYFEELDKWVWLGQHDDEITNGNNKLKYTIDSGGFYDKAILAQEKIDEINQLINAADQ